MAGEHVCEEPSAQEVRTRGWLPVVVAAIIVLNGHASKARTSWFSSSICTSHLGLLGFPRLGPGLDEERELLLSLTCPTHVSCFPSSPPAVD